MTLQFATTNLKSIVRHVAVLRLKPPAMYMAFGLTHSMASVLKSRDEDEEQHQGW